MSLAVQRSYALADSRRLSFSAETVEAGQNPLQNRALSPTELAILSQTESLRAQAQLIAISSLSMESMAGLGRMIQAINAMSVQLQVYNSTSATASRSQLVERSQAIRASAADLHDHLQSVQKLLASNPAAAQLRSAINSSMQNLAQIAPQPAAGAKVIRLAVVRPQSAAGKAALHAKGPGVANNANPAVKTSHQTKAPAAATNSHPATPHKTNAASAGTSQPSNPTTATVLKTAASKTPLTATSKGEPRTPAIPPTQNNRAQPLTTPAKTQPSSQPETTQRAATVTSLSEYKATLLAPRSRTAAASSMTMPTSSPQNGATTPQVAHSAIILNFTAASPAANGYAATGNLSGPVAASSVSTTASVSPTSPTGYATANYSTSGYNAPAMQAPPSTINNQQTYIASPTQDISSQPAQTHSQITVSAPAQESPTRLTLQQTNNLPTPTQDSSQPPQQTHQQHQQTAAEDTNSRNLPPDQLPVVPPLQPILYTSPSSGTGIYAGLVTDPNITSAIDVAPSSGTSITGSAPAQDITIQRQPVVSVSASPPERQTDTITISTAPPKPADPLKQVKIDPKLPEQPKEAPIETKLPPVPAPPPANPERSPEKPTGEPPTNPKKVAEFKSACDECTHKNCAACRPQNVTVDKGATASLFKKTNG